MFLVLLSAPHSRDRPRPVWWEGEIERVIFCSFLKNRSFIVEFVDTTAKPEFDICILDS